MTQRSLFTDDTRDDMTAVARKLLKLVGDWPNETTNQLYARLWEQDRSKIERMAMELNQLRKAGLVEQTEVPEPCPISGFMAIRWYLTKKGKERVNA